jgi:small-conductance mechanosensitive channel
MLEQLIFKLGSYEILLWQGIISILLLALWIYLFFKGLGPVYGILGLEKYRDRKKFRGLFSGSIHLIILAIFLEVLQLNTTLFTTPEYRVDIVDILIAFAIIQFARSLDWIGQDLIANTPDYLTSSDPLNASNTKTSASKLIHTILIIVAVLLLIQNFNLDKGFSTSLGKDESIVIHISNIIVAVLIILIARLINWVVTNVFLLGFYNTKEVDVGVRFAFNKLVSYVIYTLAILFALQSLNINTNLIWGGAAALLVGIGLGLQQTFADFFAGVVMLFERTIKIGDIVEISSVKGTVRKIGLRTSIVKNLDNQSLVIPNSHLTNNEVINWTYFDHEVRFEIQVGVAYGSNTEIVRELLLKVAKDNTRVLDTPVPFVRFKSFGDSALEFGLYFYSTFGFQVDDIKSNMRFEIDRLFRENNISIPFPQRDVWMRNQ